MKNSKKQTIFICGILVTSLLSGCSSNVGKNKVSNNVLIPTVAEIEYNKMIFVLIFGSRYSSPK